MSSAAVIADSIGFALALIAAGCGGRTSLEAVAARAPQEAGVTEHDSGNAAEDSGVGVEADAPGPADVVVRDAELCPVSDGGPIGQWVTTWGGDAVDRARAVFARDDDVVVGGSFNGTTNLDPNGGDLHTASARDLYFSLFRPDGTRVTSRTMGGPLLSDGLEWTGGAVAPSGAIYTATKFRGTLNADPGRSNDARTSNDWGIAVMKFARDGAYQWMRSWETRTFLNSPRVAVGPGEWVFVLGQFDGMVDFDPGPATDLRDSKDGLFFVEKLKSDGTHDWVRTWQPGNPNDGGVGDVAVALDGSIWVTGFFDEPFISKFDASGTPLFTLRWSGGNDFPRRIAIGLGGSAYVAGVFSTKNADFDPGPGEDLHSTQGDYDVFLSKFDELGQHEWTRTWGAGAPDDVGGLTVDPCGTAWVVGLLGSPADLDPGPGSDVHAEGGFLSKIRADGSFVWGKTWKTNADALAEPWSAIAVVPGGPVWLAGSFSGSVDFGVEGAPSRRTSKGRDDAFLMRLE